MAKNFAARHVDHDGRALQQYLHRGLDFSKGVWLSGVWHQQAQNKKAMEVNQRKLYSSYAGIMLMVAEVRMRACVCGTMVEPASLSRIFRSAS